MGQNEFKIIKYKMGYTAVELARAIKKIMKVDSAYGE